MAIRKILFATDFSKASERAKQLAAGMKNQLGCKLDVVHVYDPTALAMPVPYGVLPGVEQWIDTHFDAFQAKGRQALDDLCPELGPGCSGAFVEGKPGPAVVAYAAAHDIDLIIMGTHGHSGLERLMVGSVAAYVVHHASCPVLTVKGDAA